jgi:hypothetical protein
MLSTEMESSGKKEKGASTIMPAGFAAKMPFTSEALQAAHCPLSIVHSHPMARRKRN